MKKTISLFLVLTMCMSLCACGDKGQISDTNVDGDNNIPADITQTTVPPDSADSEPILITVAITADNWDEYFEIIEYPYYTTDELGDFKAAGVEHLLKLKDQYIGISGVPNVVDGARLIEYSYVWQDYTAEIDHANKTFALVEAIGEKTEGTDKTYVKLWDSFSSCYYSQNGGIGDVYPIGGGVLRDKEANGQCEISIRSIVEILRVEEFEMTLQVIAE